MRFYRIEKKFVSIPVFARKADGTVPTVASVDVALLPTNTTPTGATTWTNVAVTNGVAAVLLAGPDADPTGAVVIPAAGADLYLREIDAPEVAAVRVDSITVA